MKILCIYATRQIDSNLFMSSTIFNGLQQCGYDMDMLFWGTNDTVSSFEDNYAYYFNNVFYYKINESLLSKISKKTSLTRVVYNFYRGFVLDSIIRPYKLSRIKGMIKSEYDEVLSFVPIALAGFIAADVRSLVCPNARLTQYWTDPISLGRLDSVEIPFHRLWHKHLEKKVISKTDRAIFCYPLFCDCMKKLYPQYSERMSWIDIAYTKHEKANYKPSNKQVTIGLFGAYQKRVRNIFPFLEAVSKLKDYRFIIRGDSDVEIEPENYPNLDIKPGRVPLAEVEELEANCDILLCLAGRSGITIPAGKVFYYGDYNKPILYIGDGKHKDYCADYIRGFGRYEVCDNTVDSIIQGIHNCVNVLEGYQVQIPNRMEPSVIARKMFE